MDLVSQPQITAFKSAYVQLISKGYTEGRALQELEVDFIDFFELVAKSEDFRKEIDEARKQRAELWIGRIIDSTTARMIKLDDGTEVERIPGKDENAHRKLEFEKLKFLAKADNPDRYGDASGKNNKVEINLNDFKLLTPQESIKVLNNDPFNKMVTIEAEIIEPMEKKSEV